MIKETLFLIILFLNQSLFAAGVVVPNRCPSGFFLATARGGSSCQPIPADTTPFGIPTQSSAHQQNYQTEPAKAVVKEPAVSRPKTTKQRPASNNVNSDPVLENYTNDSLSSEQQNDLLNDNGAVTYDECRQRSGVPNKANKVCTIDSLSESVTLPLISDSSSSASADQTPCQVDVGSVSSVVDTCSEDNDSAATRCRDDKDAKTFGLPGMGESLNQVGQMVSGAMGGCSKMADMAKTAAGGFAAFEAQCSQAISACQTGCSNAKAEVEKAIADVESKCKGQDNRLTQSGEEKLNQLKEMKSDIGDYARQCADNQTSIAMASQNGQNLAMQMASSDQCKAEFSSVQSDICKVYPTLPACSGNSVVDCSKKENASSTQCICKTNPNDPNCPTSGFQPNSKIAGGSNSNGSKDLSSLLNKKPDLGGTNSLSSNDMGFDPSGLGGKGGSKSGGIPEGRGGGPLGGGGGGGHGGESPGGGASTEASSSGGISYGRGGGGYAGGGAYGSNNGEGGENEKTLRGENGKVTGLNFKKWLPGQSNDPKRNIAGVVGPDGITCSTCGTIFDKVGLRYQKVKSSLQAD